MELSDAEKDLFVILLEAAQVSGSIVRIAGGWVRDKLLGLSSDDIDVALDNSSGEEFAILVKEILAKHGHMSGSIGTIAANPEQSKHLETATMRIFNQDIDFVNLRSETYVEDSRIPVIKFGTALEDARRRDFTINSMFYNLSENKIEDLTGYGENDLLQRVLRTPLDPFVTFKDDPLRVLRAIRFAARYNFLLLPEIEIAAKHTDIRQALFEKVSRERVMKELDGMLTSSNDRCCRPFLAFTIMQKLNVYDCVFILPTPDTCKISETTVPSSVPVVNEAWKNQVQLVTAIDSLIVIPCDLAEINEWQHRSLAVAFMCNVLLHLEMQLHSTNTTLSALSHIYIRTIFQTSAVSQMDSEALPSADIQFTISSETLLQCIAGGSSSNLRVLFLSAAVSGLCHLNILEKKKLVPLSSVSLRDGLKVDNDTYKLTAIMLECVPTFMLYSLRGCSRVEAGTLLRRCQHLWRDCILLACAFELASKCAWNPAGFRQSNGEIREYTIDGEVALILKRYRILEDDIELRYCLDSCWLVSPLLDGNEIMLLLNVKKGPIIGTSMEEQVRWQLQFPSGSKEECSTHLLTMYSSVWQSPGKCTGKDNEASSNNVVT